MKQRWFFLLAGILILGGALVPYSVSVFSPSDPDVLTWVIDAGHGGEDGGAVSRDGLRESDVNLSIARRTDALLGLFGFRTLLTRETDAIDYPESALTTRERKRFDQNRRVELVRNAENAVLVSIHQNIYATGGPSGAQVFFGKDAGSEGFAQAAQGYFAAVCGKERQAALISEDIFLMREAHCPAILIECGFLSNSDEAAMLATEDYQKKLSLAAAAACIGYAEELERVYGKG